MKTSKLTGAALDWAVAKCEGVKLNDGNTLSNDCDFYTPSTDWAQGGPIIEREEINILNQNRIVAWQRGRETFGAGGPTPLIAAMRCYVASKLGDDVEIPEELMEQA